MRFTFRLQLSGKAGNLSPTEGRRIFRGPGDWEETAQILQGDSQTSLSKDNLRIGHNPFWDAH